MKHATKIQALEGLLSRVQRRASEPRGARVAPPAVEPSPVAARVEHDPAPAAPSFDSAKALDSHAAQKVEAPPAPPSAPEAGLAAPPTAKQIDDAPATRDSQQLEELGPADEELGPADEELGPADEELGPADEAPASSARPRLDQAPTAELEVLEEDDVIDGSPAPPQAALPAAAVVAAVTTAVVEPPPSSKDVVSAELVPETPPPRPQLRSVPPPLPSASKSERPRSIPPPFPGVAKPPKPESLEAEVPQRRDPGPTAEQLGGTIDLEEGPAANLELAPVEGPKAEETPSEDEAVLPKATSPGLFTGPRPSAPQETPEESATGVSLEVPASPAPLPAPAPLAPPAPIAIAAEVSARVVPSAEVARFVAAARAASPDKLGALLDATLSLGTGDRIG